MLCRFSNFILLLSFLSAPLFCLKVKAATAAQIATALDNPPGVVFSASNNSKWSSKTGTVSDINRSGVPSFNNNYLVGSSPGKADPQQENYFKVTVKGSGTLSFKYQVSLDYTNGAELCAYEDEEWLFSASDFLDDNDGEGAKWWEEDELDLGTETYTHTITFSILGPLDEEDFENPELDKDSGEKLKDKAWLDHFVWEPDEDAVLFAFDPNPEEDNSFNDWQIVYLDSDYDNLTFRYTTDGKTPTATSDLYDPAVGIHITETTTITAIIYEGSTRINNNLYRATYQLRTAPPQLSLEQDNFQSNALLKFSSETTGATFYYTLNDNVPIRLENGEPGENTFKGSQVTLTGASTVQVMAWAAGFANSNVVTRTYQKLSKSSYSTGHPYFDKTTTLTITAAAGTTIKYQINDEPIEEYSGPLTISKSSTIRFQAQELGKLHSDVVTLKFYKTSEEFTLTEPAGLGWSLFFLPGHVSQESSDMLITQLQPIAYDSQKKIYFRPTLLLGGESYWVFTPNVETWPNEFLIHPLENITLPAKTWLLSGTKLPLPEDVQAQTWTGQTFALPQTTAELPIPAWLYNSGSNPIELPIDLP